MIITCAFTTIPPYTDLADTGAWFFHANIPSGEKLLVEIKQAGLSEGEQAARLAALLWPHHDAAGLLAEMERLIRSDDAAVFLCLESDCAVGFAQCSLRRDYVEGASDSPVAYLEGLFVSETHRHQGIAKNLLRAGERWGREKGCGEFASDCSLNDYDSFTFHLRNGFSEANRVICFIKKIV